MEPFSPDANKGIEDTSEYQNGSCNSEGWRNLGVYW